jgi:hypothetical protein
MKKSIVVALGLVPDSTVSSRGYAKQSWIPDWQDMITWPGVLVILAIPCVCWIMVATSVSLALVVGRFRYGRLKPLPAALSFEEGRGLVLEHMLAVKHQAAAAIFERRRRRGIPTLAVRTQPVAEPHDSSADVLDRLTTLKQQGAWNPQVAQ